MSEKIVRIGGASGYWGDTTIGPTQLLAMDGLDYMVLDYLAEITMSILAKAKAKDPEAGYATDFITQVMRPLVRDIAAKKVKVIANAGGLNLSACRRALQQVAQDAGVKLRVGTVEGDDLSAQLPVLRPSAREMDSGAPLPERIMSANAYLGAFPIAAALAAGADIVVTGRCVDSALVVGPLIHEFGWRADDFDRLAAGSLAGHLLECGAQVAGGNFTDWEETVDGWDNTGFPVAEVSSDGSFVLTKPTGTGGKVTPLTAGEQMLYEIGDPARYILPDVTCDFTAVRIDDCGHDRVRVTGAKGHSPTSQFKVSATYSDGFACIGNFAVAGENAAVKARRQGEAVLRKVGRLLVSRGLPDFTRSAMQIVGTEALYGDAADPALASNREVVLRLGIQHPKQEGADLFSREFVGAGLSMAPGLTLLSPGRPKPSPLVRLYSFLVDKDAVDITVKVEGETIPFAPVSPGGTAPPVPLRPQPAAMEAHPMPPQAATEVPLRRLAVARSGDKGDKANIGVIARRPEYLPVIQACLTPDRVKRCFAHLAAGEVECFELPGIHGLNILLHRALGGGGASSLNLDPQAKTYAQLLLDVAVPVPDNLAREWKLAG